MNFRIADTFTASLARLTADEQRAVKTTAFDLQMDPANPGFSFHRLDKARDKSFWSVRVNRDVRLIVHKTAESLLLAYVDHHDDAYRWAERRRLETHPTTGAAQWVETRERIEEVGFDRPRVAALAAAEASPIYMVAPLAGRSNEDLLTWGVPAEWLDSVRQADDDELLRLAEQLPAEAAEALLTLATGGTPEPRPVAAPNADPFEHPDAQRRFRTIGDHAELERALEWPWDRWTVFLHPDQRQWVERVQSGPARVAGSAGTGKTVVALHRAVHLAHANPDARVLLTTFSEPLAAGLQALLRRLVGRTPMLAERMDVVSLDVLGERLHRFIAGEERLAADVEIRRLLVEGSETSAESLPAHLRSAGFLVSEWGDVVDQWQLDRWEAYRDFKRLGRKTRLSEKHRRALWDVFEHVRGGLQQQGLTTRATQFAMLARHYETAKPPFEHVIVDEAQDIGPAQLRFLAALAADKPNGLFFAGDTGQRIFRTAFSWKALGVDVRGRARTLKVNYRTSHQIRAQADLLLGPEISDVDGLVETRRGTVSVFNGRAPEISFFDSSPIEADACGRWLKACVNAGIAPGEIGVFVRSEAEITRAQAACAAAGLAMTVIDRYVDTETGAVSIGTMHLAKGLEFRGVAVIACDEGLLPSNERSAEATDESELREIHETERQLLYVACTRARDRLWVSGVKPGSEFLADLAAR